MPLPREFGRFNKIVTNRLFAPLAGRVPPWVIVEHRGRRSDRVYRTVLFGFPSRHDFVFALTYGPDTDWVRNVLAAQWCRVKFAGRWRTYSHAELVKDEAALRLLPPLLGQMLNLSGVRAALYVTNGG